MTTTTDQLGAERLMTAEEFYERDDATGCELVRGRVTGTGHAAPHASSVAGRVTARLGRHVEEHNLGVYGVSGGSFVLRRNPDTVRTPDVWFVAKDRLPESGVPEQLWEIAPDLVIEVISPSYGASTGFQMLRDYIDGGVRAVWVFDPDGKRVIVWPERGAMQFIKEDGVLDGEDIVPGFTLPLSDVFG